MGEKPASNKPPRCAILLPMKPEQLEAIKAAASAEGMPTATWVRVVAIKAAKAAKRAAKGE